MSEPLGSEGTTQRLPVLDKPAEDDVPAPAPAPGSGRFWSARRVPAAVVALLLAALAGVLLYDVAAVRADRSALWVRRELTRQLAERTLDDIWVLVGAGVAAALGLWLILLAVTPGLRDVLPMRRPHPDVRAGLHRGAAALVLRDRAMEVAGVQSVHVRAGRRRADVRAVSHFRDLDDVRTELDAVLGDAVRGLGLARPPALSVRVRRLGRKG
ncbi:hypothetical protein BM536_021260 [Streptomyces phaeoluteigriseus]|uniref:DUF6286 domain-containing protein n=1 Tax=Streptomyces phaeoluteigriseus TaxID=114686 RepID=A0A1V6MPW6_9ACTN|nr:DUF6286 domain-containing protein [Streptomyces phaeoluteigriseus]OQD54501.1 hypothetical protein BM536_021260 [Streptomyces phaeoluteigriseus]